MHQLERELDKINEKIRKIRELKNFSQESMAEQLQMSVNGYAKIERGEVGVQIDKLEQIAQVFGIEVIDLLSIDRNFVFLNAENSSNSANYYSSPEQYVFEIDNLKQQVSHLQNLLAEKNEFIEQQRQQITTLHELLLAIKGSQSL